MYKLFDLKILTPERTFFDGQAEVLVLTVPDGQMAFLARHSPLIAPVEIGELKIFADNEWREAFTSEGFLEVTQKGVMVYVQACEWPEEIDERRAREALERAEEHLRQRQSIAEYQQSKIALSRAMARLQVKNSYRQ